MILPAALRDVFQGRRDPAFHNLLNIWAVEDDALIGVDLQYTKLLRLTCPDALGPAHGVHLIHSMDDTFAVMRTLEETAPARAVIVGAGYIGLEMAEALVARGVDVTLFATNDSRTAGKLAGVCPTSYSEDPAIDAKVWEMLHVAHVFERAGEFDLIHNQADFVPLAFSRLVETPVVTTIRRAPSATACRRVCSRSSAPRSRPSSSTSPAATSASNSFSAFPVFHFPNFPISENDS